ncbi:signal transduction histidine kinase [Oxalobacteraceae bacterium GrIS 1.11]
MRRLYFRFYIALLGSLLLFALATAALWHRDGGPVDRADTTLARLLQNTLAPAAAPAAEQQAALARLAAGIDGDVSLFDQAWTRLATVGQPLAPPAARQGMPALRPWHLGAVSFIHLADGRTLVASVPLGFERGRPALHSLLALLALAIGVAAFPVVRQLTRRLERLQRGVESLGAGDLGARVAVEGHDEVAQLAQSFNRAAAQIEQLVGAHKSLLANASHELRTPLARIGLALELMKETADPKRKAGLEQDIQELDGLLDEILLASRLDSVAATLAAEPLDLLALAAEECARYDAVELEGVPLAMVGDARLLRRLLRNLLENARRHGAPPTMVRIDGDVEHATITVSDDGAGVPAAEFERIFEPFYRRRDSRDHAGTGLGLALVRQIAGLHGGDARCATLGDALSDAPDTRRSCFIVRLARRRNQP